MFSSRFVWLIVFFVALAGMLDGRIYRPLRSPQPPSPQGRSIISSVVGGAGGAIGTGLTFYAADRVVDMVDGESKAEKELHTRKQELDGVRNELTHTLLDHRMKDIANMVTSNKSTESLWAYYGGVLIMGIVCIIVSVITCV